MRRQLSQPSFVNGFARSKNESVRPDLWPDHAWVPALGCQGGVLYDLCGASLASLSGTSWGGEALNFSGSGAAVLAPTNRIAYSTRGLTVFVIFTPATGGQERQSIVQSYAHGNATPGYRGYTVGTYNGGFEVGVRRSDVDYLRKNTQPLTVGTQHVGSVTYRGDGTEPDVMVDGTRPALTISIQSGAPLDEMATPTGRPTVAGGVGELYWGVERPYSGSISAIYIYLRAVVADAIHADPLLPFRRRAPVFYSVPSGGPTFNAAWARNSNVIIQPGVY